MNTRFAEECSNKHLELNEFEDRVRRESFDDGRAKHEQNLTCQQDLFIGVFFDGTNNNKYRDALSFSHSNVARLYEAYPGTPAKQAPLPPTQKNGVGKKQARQGISVEAPPFKPSTIPAHQIAYYRKIYLPGVGTPMLDVGDTGEGKQKTGGLALALLGQARLDWALLQLVNQVHAAIFNEPLEPTVDMGQLYQHRISKPPAAISYFPQVIIEQKLESQLIKWAQALQQTTGTYNPAAFNRLLESYISRLAAKLKQRGHNKPDLRKIRLSVFGFSRGAAQARAWVNMVNERFGSALGGITLQIDFLGIFDTVASVGLAQSTPYFEGHAEWGDGAYMVIPSNVKRCVHLVAAHEVRCSFPLDSVCQGDKLPFNCKEIVYPGVHSDVGGGYPPNDQGRAIGEGAVGDALKLSQIPLAQMYREARMAGVPLAPESAMAGFRIQNFAISPQLKTNFNTYIAATRSGSIPATQGSGDAQFARMFPTETQPREELHRIMRRHAGFLLRWRKWMISRGGIATLPNLKQNPLKSHIQDIEDFRGAEEELKKEIAFLRDPNPQKFKVIDDALFNQVLNGLDTAAPVAALSNLPLSGWLYVASWGLKGSVADVMREKQKQWDSWLQAEWDDQSTNALPKAAEVLFETHLHDSRAWFKMLMRTDINSLAPDDEEWFALGGLERERDARVAEQQQLISQQQKSGSPRAFVAVNEATHQLQQLQQEGHPLVVGGREPYRMWGYIRHRKIYQSGQLHDATYATRQHAIENEEAKRIRQKAHTDLIIQENTRHEAELKKITDYANEGLKSGKIKKEHIAEFRESTKAKIEYENKFHDNALIRIEKDYGG